SESSATGAGAPTEVDVAGGAGEQQPAESRPHELVLTLPVGAEAVLLDHRGVDREGLAGVPVPGRVERAVLQLVAVRLIGVLALDDAVEGRGPPLADRELVARAEAPAGVLAAHDDFLVVVVVGEGVGDRRP